MAKQEAKLTTEQEDKEQITVNMETWKTAWLHKLRCA